MRRGPVRFEQPVIVLVGLGYPRRVENALAACSLLQDMPETGQAELRDAALAACRAAISGEVAVERARALFAAYAERKGILVESAAAPIACIAAGEQPGA